MSPVPPPAALPPAASNPPGTGTPDVRAILLIVDPRPKTREWLGTEPVRLLAKATGVRLALATGPGSARAALGEKASQEAGLILLHPHFAEAPTIADLAFTAAPQAPVYLLGETEEPGDPLPTEVAKPNVRGWLENPIHLPRLETLILAYCRARAGRRTPAQGDYVSVRLDDLAQRPHALLDLFVREEGGSFKLIAEAGKPIDGEFREKITQGTLKTFFIRRDAQESYVRYCERIATSLVKSETAESRLKVMQSLLLGKEALSLMQARGLSAESFEFVGKFVLNLGRSVEALNLTRNDQVSNYLAQSGQYGHSTSVAAMAGLMARAMNLGSVVTASQIGMAGLLHDIGLQLLRLPDHDFFGDKMQSPEERALFETHPIVAVEELSRLGTLDPLVLQAIEQHHIRRDGSGFPQQSRYSFVHICSEIIGICDEFDGRVRHKQANPGFDVTASMRDVFPGFSKPVVNAFQKIFLGGADAPRTAASSDAPTQLEGDAS